MPGNPHGDGSGVGAGSQEVPHRVLASTQGAVGRFGHLVSVGEFPVPQVSPPGFEGQEALAGGDFICAPHEGAALLVQVR